MSNLLITVMAIALVAATSATGMWYGGGAFIDKQAKAQAQQLINSSDQIAMAWRKYAFDNGGDFTLADADWTDGTATDLVPQYLSTLPKLPFISLMRITLFSLPNSYTDNSPNSNFIQLTLSQKETCEQVNLITNGSKTISSSSVPAALSASRPYSCLGSAGVYYFRYRVF